MIQYEQLPLMKEKEKTRKNNIILKLHIWNWPQNQQPQMHWYTSQFQLMYFPTLIVRIVPNFIRLSYFVTYWYSGLF